MASDITDSLRGLRQQLTQAVAYARTAIRTGKRVDEFVGGYLELIRLVHERQEQGKALGRSGILFDPMMPIPFRTQLVDLSDAERRRLEWSPFETHTAPRRMARAA